MSKYLSSLVLSFHSADETLVCDCHCIDRVTQLTVPICFSFCFRSDKDLFFSVGKEQNASVLNFTGASPKIMIPVRNC